MNALARLFLIGGVFLGVAGCLGTSSAPGSDSFGLVAADEDDLVHEALVTELWCATCVEDGMRALSLSHDVRFHSTRGKNTVIVEIDGVLACAGHAVEPLEELEADGDGGGGGEDEGNPDPEPALPGVLLPSPVTQPHVERKEDEGNPDPEPALDKPLPGPRPSLSPSHGL